jgi:hypothetical protein
MDICKIFYDPHAGSRLFEENKKHKMKKNA